MVSRFSTVSLFVPVYFHLIHASTTTLHQPVYKEGIRNADKPFTITVGNSKKIFLNQYLSLTKLDEILMELSTDYKDIVKLWPLGRSAVDNTTIQAVQISRNVQEERKLLKPMFKFVGNIHGNGVVGYYLMVILIQYLVYSDGYDTRITQMLDDIDVWIVPTMNPDGFRKLKPNYDCDYETEDDDYRTAKLNGNGVDLDRDFPYSMLEKEWTGQPETMSILKLILEHPFVLSGSFKNVGSFVSYPWAYSSDKSKGELSLTDDNDVFVDLARHYAFNHPWMSTGRGCTKSLRPQNGILNGNFWENKRGGMQDANYILSNCFEISIHPDCCKQPSPNNLYTYWYNHLESMLSFIESTRHGIYGLVLDKKRKPVRDALVLIAGRKKEIKVTADGEYWRLLIWGVYNLIVKAPGYKTFSTLVMVPEEKPNSVRFDVILELQGMHGKVMDRNGLAIKNAVIKVEGCEVFTANVDELGEYRVSLKIKSRCEYKITACVPGYSQKKITKVLSHEIPYVQEDFVLVKKASLFKSEC